MKNVIEGKVVRDPDCINGSPHVMIEGRSFDPDHLDRGIGSGTYHGRFFIDYEHIGKRVRVTIEVDDE